MASDTNNIGLYIGAPPASGGQTTEEVMSGIGTPVKPDGTVESQVGGYAWPRLSETYWDPNEIQTGEVNHKSSAWPPAVGDGDGGQRLPLGTPDQTNPKAAAFDRRYGEGIGFSVAVDGDYMVVGAPYAIQKFRYRDGGGRESLNAVAEQTYIEGVPGHTDDCFGVITITVTGNLQKLWPSGTYGELEFLGKKWQYAGDLTLPGASPPESWEGFTWYLTSYDGGETGIEGSATIKAYPCDSVMDCWVGTPPHAGTCSWNIGFIEDEAGIEILEASFKIYGPEIPVSDTYWYMQAGAVYVFKKRRGLITNATNTTPIVVTLDPVNLNGTTRTKIAIQDVSGNTAANGEFWAKLADDTYTNFELYLDRDFKNPVSGNGDFKSGGSYKGAGSWSWVRMGTIQAPFPAGWSEANFMAMSGYYSRGAGERHFPLNSDARFGWSVDIKDGWILVGEPRGYPSLGGKLYNGPREGSFSYQMVSDYLAFGQVRLGLSRMDEISGDPSTSGRVYIYHVDRAVTGNSLPVFQNYASSIYEKSVIELDHPNPHLNPAGWSHVYSEPNNLPTSQTGYEGPIPNARIVPEYLYSEEEDSQVTYNMGTPNLSPRSYVSSTPFTRGTDAHFGHSVAFSPKIEGAPFGPDNPVTILIGAPYARIDKNESGVVGEEVESDQDIPSEGDEVPDPSGDGFGGDEFFVGDGSGDGETLGEGGLIPEPGTGDAGGTTGVETGGSGESTGESSAPAPTPRETVNRVGHTYAFIGAYPDSGNASYSVWKGLPNLYMGNESIGDVAYNQSNIKASGEYIINNLFGRDKVSNSQGNAIDLVPIKDHYKWQRLEHRIYNDAHPYGVDGRAAQDRFGWSVGIHGNTAIVGAPRHGLGNSDSELHFGYRFFIKDAGAAYVYKRSSHDAYFDTIEPGGSGALFTKYVGIDENAIAISGASPLHHRNIYDNFGYSVDINENFFAVGAPRHAASSMGRDFSKEEGGAVYIWEKQFGGHYNFDQKICHNEQKYGFHYGSHIGNTTDPYYIVGSGRDAYSHFGASISLCGSNLLAGAPFAGGGLEYDYDSLLHTHTNFREKLSTEYVKGGDGQSISVPGYTGSANTWDENDFPDNNNVKPLYRGGTIPGINGIKAGPNYVGNGRTYLFQRQGNREDTRVDQNVTATSELDDATVNSSTESYDDSSDTIAAGGNLTGGTYGLLRFSSLGIPRGSQIHNAYIEMSAAADDDGRTEMTIYAFDEDDGEMPSGGGDDEPGESGDEYANFLVKLNSKKTLNKSVWNLSRSLAGKKVSTVPIGGIIQEIVDRPGWSDDNSIVIVFGPRESDNPPNGKKVFYSSNYGTRYSSGDDTGVDTRPRIHINFSESRDQWKQTHEFKPASEGRVASYDYGRGGYGHIKDYGRSVSLSKEDIITGGPEYDGGYSESYTSPSLGNLGYVLDHNMDYADPTIRRDDIGFTISGGSGSISHRPFVGLGCRGSGPPGTPGGNFPHIFSLSTKGHAVLAREMDAYTMGHALHSGNITLTIPKAHAKFSHAMPLHIGVKRARHWGSLYTQGHMSSTNSMTLSMRDTPSGNISLFLKNFQFTAGPSELGGDEGLTLHAEGLRPASETAELFTMGPMPSSGDITLHHRGGHIPVNSPIGDFPEGHPSLYASGSPAVVTATGSLHILGPVLSIGTIDITGPYNLTASGQMSLYARGMSTDNTTFNLFLEKATGDIDDGIKLYTAGPITDDGSTTLFTKYETNCASSATSSHDIVKLKKQQTILGENVLGTEDGSTGYNMGGLWGMNNNYTYVPSRRHHPSNRYFSSARSAPDSPRHAYVFVYGFKNNDGIDVDGKTMAVATLGVRYMSKPIGYNYYPDINGLVKIYDWDGDTDSWTLSQTIKHPNDETEIAPRHTGFGSSVAIDDTNGILVVGEYLQVLTPSGNKQNATLYGSATLDSSGEAHVYRKINGVWTYEATIDGATILSDGSTPSVNDKKGSDYQVTGQGRPGPFDRFGTYVAIDNGVIIAGAPHQSFGTGSTIQQQVQYSGAVYVFEYNSSLSRWERTQKLVNPDRVLHVGSSGSSERLDAEYDASYFGLICKIKGDTIVVGAPGQALRLKNGAVQASDGHRIDGAGAVYIFDKSSGTWSFTKSFHSRGQGSTNEGTVDESLNYETGEDYAANFGASLDFYGNNIVVGAPKKKVSGNYLAGESYILEKSSATWSLKYAITPTETFADGSAVHSEQDGFGYHVSIMNEDVVFISSPKHSYGVAPSTTADTAGANTGAIYVFGINGGNQIRKLVREEVVENQFFGYNNVAFSQGCDAQLMTLTHGVSTPQEGNILDLYQYLSALPLNIRGPLESNSNISLFAEGVGSLSDVAPLFTEGMTPANEDTTLVMLGPYGISDTSTLHTDGLSNYQTVFNLTLKASMIGPEIDPGTYSTLSLVTKGPIGASSAGWPYWNLQDHRYARKFDITVRSGFYTNDTNAFHIDRNYPPYYYNADPPEYGWGDPILERGRSYIFDLSDSSNSGHTLYLSKVNDGGGPSSNYYEEYLNGVSGSRSTQGGQLEFHVPNDAPEYLYVHCGLHSGMGWRIQIINKRASTPEGMSLYIEPAPLSFSNTMDLLVEGSTNSAWGTRSDTSMGLFAKVRDIYPQSSGINLYTRSVGTTEIETFSHMNLWTQSTDIAGDANTADYMNLFLKPQTKVDVTSNMNLSLLTPAHPTEDITLYLHNTQTKKEANIFTAATGGMNLFLGTTSGVPFGVLPDSSMNLVMPIKGLSDGQQFASRSFDGTFPDAGLDLYIGNTDTSGSMPLFTKSVYYATEDISLSVPSSVGAHSGISTFMIRGYNDSDSGI